MMPLRLAFIFVQHLPLLRKKTKSLPTQKQRKENPLNKDRRERHTFLLFNKSQARCDAPHGGTNVMNRRKGNSMFCMHKPL